MMLIPDGVRVKVFLRNGRKYSGTATQLTPGFIRVSDEVDRKLHIIAVDEILEIEVLSS